MSNYSDLKDEVKRLNDKYCKNSKNELVINRAYGGFEVLLKAKTGKNGKKLKSGLGSGAVSITYGHDTSLNTLNSLYKSESRGWLQSTIKHYK